MRRDQRALRRKFHLNDVEDALIGIDFGGAFRLAASERKRRRQPLAKVAPLSLVQRPVDRALGLRIGAGEIQQDLVAASWSW